MVNFSCYNQNSAVVVITIPRFFHPITQRVLQRRLSQEIQDLCFLVIHNQLSRFLFLSFLSMSKWILSSWEQTYSKRQRYRIDQTRGKQELCVTNHALFHQITYPNPLLLCYCSFKPSPKPVFTHTYLLFGQHPSFCLADPLAYHSYYLSL